jgi:putative spermidine/putrescine transport system ATP-binding protein
VTTAAGTKAELEVVGLHKQFNGVPVVNDVSLTLRAGEFLTMLGPSGSGKTTTLRMIAGFEHPDRGEIRLRGQDLTALPVYERGIGMVFQNYALFPHLSALRNIAFPLEMRGVGRTEARRRAMSALEMVELGSQAKKLPKQLSGGQQQRVALARAIVFEPDILLMDEPLGALDKRLRETMQLEIMRITREVGATVVYVTHDQEEALVMSDRIAIYNQGRIEQIGTAQDLYERPTSLFVADFIGESNVLTGHAEPGNGVVRGATWVADVPSSATVTGSGPVSLVVRPEMLRIASGAAPEGRNRLEGRVQEAIYLGGVRKYTVRVADGSLLECRVPRTGTESVLDPGDEVTLSWHPDQVVLLPAAERAERTEPADAGAAA